MNLFNKLSKYKSTTKVSPEENFFTEGFTYILQSNRKLAKELFQHVDFKVSDKTVIRTQQLIPPNSIIDLYLENESCKALVEIKLAADLNKYEDDLGETYDQLTKYSNYLEGNDKVILIAFESDINKIRENKYGFNVQFLAWEQVHKVITKQKNQSSLLKQFSTFMESKSMNYFSGLEQDFFKSIGVDEDIQIKVASALRKQFNELCNEMFTQLKKQDTSWRMFIYSYDTTKKRYYCHFQNPNSNTLGLNINVEATPSGLGVLVWIPYWKFNESNKVEEQGKINSTEICKLLDHFQNDQEELKKKLMPILNSIDSNYNLSLHVKQYEHIKTSSKKAQGMQKGHDVELLKLNKGNTLIPNVKDNTLMIDRSKEVYDNTKTATFIHSISKSQIGILVDMLYEKSEAYSNLKKFLIIRKDYPSKYVRESKVKVTSVLRNNIIDFQKIIMQLNRLI